MSTDFLRSAIIRAVKTFFQTILGMWTAGAVITQMDWKTILLASVSASLYSLLTSIVGGLPEVSYGHEFTDEEADFVDWGREE